MQEKKYDGSEILTDKATIDNFADALKQEANKMVALHKPGSTIKLKDRSFYRVDKDGAWQKISDDEIIKALEE